MCPGTHNVLIDPETLQVTALLDFEFCQIATPVEEYLYSFYDINCILPGPHTTDDGLAVLRTSLLHGFPTPLPESPPPQTGPVRFGAKKNIQWHIAKAWDDELEKVGALRPATIPSSPEISALHWFCQDICPFYFLQKMWIDTRAPGEVEQEKKKREALLDKYLTGWGY